MIATQVETQPLAAFNPFALAPPRPPSRSLVHGTGAGNIATLNAPAAQMQRPQGADTQDIMETPLSLMPLPTLGNDQWTLTTDLIPGATAFFPTFSPTRGCHVQDRERPAVHPHRPGPRCPSTAAMNARTLKVRFRVRSVDDPEPARPRDCGRHRVLPAQHRGPPRTWPTRPASPVPSDEALTSHSRGALRPDGRGRGYFAAVNKTKLGN